MRLVVMDGCATLQLQSARQVNGKIPRKTSQSDGLPGAPLQGRACSLSRQIYQYGLGRMSSL